MNLLEILEEELAGLVLLALELLTPVEVNIILPAVSKTGTYFTQYI